MFSHEQTEAYKSIEAPEELYARVINCKPRKKPLYIIPIAASLAACLILVFGIAVSGFYSEPDIVFNGASLTDSVMFYDISPVSELDARVTPVLSLPVEIDLDTETEITVSEGFIIAEGYNPNSTIKADKPVNLLWEIERSEHTPDECTMTIATQKGETVITLAYNSADNSYTATRN